MHSFLVFALFLKVVFGEGLTASYLQASLFGGSSLDSVYGTTYDASGTIIAFSGVTYSNNFPVLNTIPGQTTGNVDGFLFILNTNNYNILFSSLFGGTGTDYLGDITFGPDGNIYFCGTTSSLDLLTTGNAFYHTNQGEGDFIIGSFNLSSRTLSYSSYFGGSGDEIASSIAVDKVDGSIYVVGRSGSPTVPNINSEFTSNSGGDDFLIAGFTSQYNSIHFVTLFGGSFNDYPLSVNLYYPMIGSPASLIFVAGDCSSNNVPLINQIPQYVGGSLDALAVAYTPSGNRVWTSKFGGIADDNLGIIRVDSSRKILYFCGFSLSSGMATPNATDTVNFGLYSDGLIASVDIENISSPSVNWVTYYGGNGVDRILGCTTDSDGNFWAIGVSTSTDFRFLNNFEILASNSDEFGFVLSLNSNVAIKGNELLLGGYSGDPNQKLINTLQPFQGGSDCWFARMRINPNENITTGSIVPITTSQITTSILSTGIVMITSGEITTSNEQQAESSDQNRDNTSVFIIAGVLVFVVVVITVVISLVVVVIKKLNQTSTNVEKEKDDLEISPISVSSHRTINLSSDSSIHEVQDVEIQTKLGEGKFGDVYLAVWHGAFVAAKKPKGEEAWLSFQREAELLNLMRHPNVIQYLGIYIDKFGTQYIITDYMNKGSLVDVLRSTKISTNDKMSISIQCCKALLHLEKANCVHRNQFLYYLYLCSRDVAARNYLVSTSEGSSYQVKLSDFGMARKLDGDEIYQMKEGPIPVRWCAPEILLRKSYSTKSDVYAFGVTLWEIFNDGLQPWSQKQNQEVAHIIAEGREYMEPGNMPEEIYAIAFTCWKAEPALRPTFEIILESISRFGNLVATPLRTSAKIANDMDYSGSQITLEASKGGSKSSHTYEMLTSDVIKQ